MKNKKPKYLIVDSKNILNQLYSFERVFICNDFDNWYYQLCMVSLNKLFDSYNIPEELQKIIIKINTPCFMMREANEYITNFSFEWNHRKIKRQEGQKNVTFFSCPIFYNNTLFREKINITTKFQYADYNEVEMFLERLVESGCKEHYHKVLKLFFDKNLRLDSIFREYVNDEVEQNDSKVNVKRILSKFNNN